MAKRMRRFKIGARYTAVFLAVIPVCFLLSLIGRVHAEEPSKQSVPASAGEMSAHFAVADFDGDQRPDLATVETGLVNSSQARYWIRFDLSTGNREPIGVTAPVGGLHLDPRDVNGDSVPDLIVTTTFLHQPVAVLLNDGHGDFTLADPASFPLSLWGFETGWSAPTLQLRGDEAVLQGRLPIREIEERQSLTIPRDGPGKISLVAANDPVSGAHPSSASRAPPFLIHTV